MADLPCAGRRVILALTVRKFVCRTLSCPRQIFTERLPDLVQLYARMINRLREALLALGLVTSAQVNEWLVPSLGMQVSAPTLLRHMCRVACPPPSSVRILGVDDWRGERARPRVRSWWVWKIAVRSICLPTARRKRSRPGYEPIRNQLALE